MGERVPFVEDTELGVVPDTKQAEEAVHFDTFDSTESGQLLLWEAIRIVPVPEGPIVSEK